MSDVKVIKTPDIVSGLRKRYCAPEWAMFFNVANGTGAQAYRFADAIGMCLYPSRGLEIHGFEIKVSKSDYRREAADPNKAETIAAYCDRWWIVTPPHLLDNELLPPKWGWLSYDGRAFYTKQKAEKTATKALDRSFLAAILRRAHESNDVLLADQITKKTEGIREEIDREVTSEVERRTSAHKHLTDAVAEFEAESGLKFNTWRAKELARAVAIVEASGVTAVFNNGFTLADRLRQTAIDIEKAYADAGMSRPAKSDPA